MPIRWGEPEAQKIRAFDRMVRQLEIEARQNRRNGWHGNAVERDADDLPPGMSLDTRRETLDQLTRLGYWRRLDEGESDGNRSCYYEVINWWLTTDDDEAEFEDMEGF